jgi:hypothetical protein
MTLIDKFAWIQLANGRILPQALGHARRITCSPTSQMRLSGKRRPGPFDMPI